MARSLTASDRSSLIRLASSMPVGSPERRAILAGLKTAAMSDAEGWALAERFKNADSYAKQKQVLKEIMDEFKDTHGGDWTRWVDYANAFRKWYYEKGGELNRAMYAWQDRQDPRVIIVPSDDIMADWSKQLVLLGKKVYETALSDPGKIPRFERGWQGYHNTGLISPQVDKALSMGRGGTSYNPIGYPNYNDKKPRGWS